MELYEVKPLKKRDLALSVPASKSILSRALLLSAFTAGETVLLGCGDLGQDGRDLIGCLGALGIAVRQHDGVLSVYGREDFYRKAALNVGSAGTAARFLTAILAFFGGEYTFDASEQMKKRPMDLLTVLEREGVKLEYLGETGHFPFRMYSGGVGARLLQVDTDVSTQYASGLMLAGALGREPLTLRLTGSRACGSYLSVTADVIRAFGGNVERKGNELTVSPLRGKPARYTVAPDVSGACYFYALSLLCGAKTLVRGVHADCGQPDLRFLDVLGARGVAVGETPEGIVADGRELSCFEGFDLDLRDFSDQALTFAAMAPFAASPSRLRNIGHVRRQECDRIEAALRALTALGVPCSCQGDDLLIRPAPVRPARIETFGDHRVAMAFSLAGLKAGGVQIENPACCNKTFGRFFEILDDLT